MGYSQQYQRGRAKAHAVTRRCRRCEQYYETSDQDTENLCLRCLPDREFEQRVAEWFLKSPFARFELYSIFDEGRVRVILNGGRDWVEFEKEHPVYIEATGGRRSSGAGSLCKSRESACDSQPAENLFQTRPRCAVVSGRRRIAIRHSGVSDWVS